MKKIDFVCVGVQKAGTTTLHNILNQNPNLVLPERKETHFFSDEQLFNKGIDTYSNFFKNLNSSKFVGEIDPEYSFSKNAAQRIYEVFGKIKIIIILRNPVERAYSHYLMTKRRGLEDLHFEEAIENEKGRIKTEKDRMHLSYISRGMYLWQVDNYKTIFGSKNVKLIIFEDFIANKDKYIRDISDFIGLPDFPYTTDLKSNPASSPRFKSVQQFIYGESKLKKAIGSLIRSKEVKRRLAQYLESVNLKASRRKVLSNDTKKIIYERFYREEIEKIENKYMLNLSTWKL